MIIMSKRLVKGRKAKIDRRKKDRSYFRLPSSLLCLSICVYLCLSVAEAAADWPLFRGNPLQTGVASSALPADLVVRWKFKTKDSIEAAAAIVDGVVYAGSFDEHLYALDLKTGKEKWKVKLGAIRA